MARMIPDEMPAGSSQGQRIVFDILQKLPKNYIVYYEPFIRNKRPDFVIICPDIGVLVIEVKGWDLFHIKKADMKEVIYFSGGQEMRDAHPLYQAYKYSNQLMNLLGLHNKSSLLKHQNGKYKGYLQFPFGNMGILTNITRGDLKSINNGVFMEIFPENSIATRDEIDNWVTLKEKQIKEKIRSFFQPSWPIESINQEQQKILDSIINPSWEMNQEQINILRASINPEIVFSETDEEIKICDEKQEQHASDIGSGHRVIYGVAGSGKTVMLIAKAKLLASIPNYQILFLCFNVTLSVYLKKQLSCYKNVNVIHFHGWAKSQKVKQKDNQSSIDFGFELLKVLRKKSEEFGKYDAVLIDESQDFEPIWFSCALQALKEPRDGDFIVVADGNQGLYKRDSFTWKDFGINAIGRTKYKRLDLDKNYRNTKEIFSLAIDFSTNTRISADDDVDFNNSDHCIAEREGKKPIIYKNKNRREENKKLISILSELKEGKFGNHKIPPLEWNQIGILYPTMNKLFNARVGKTLLPMLKEICPETKWISNPFSPKNKSNITQSGIKLLSIWQSKGLQFKAVVLFGLEYLNYDIKHREEANRLMYVALTRPTDFLIISYSTDTELSNKIEKSGKVEIC